MKPTLAIINASTVLEDSAFPPVCAALQKQISGDFAPLWSKDATVVFTPKGSLPPAGAWAIACSDTIDAANALGYHDVTSDDQPLGKVGIKTTQDDGGRWEVTLGHEALEMLGDPDIIRCVMVPVSQTQNVVLAYETCDAVEEATYLIDGVPMTDFVTQEWFEPSRSGVPFSFLKTVSKPLTLAPGGYIGIFRVNGGGWSQITADKGTYASHQGSALLLANSTYPTHVTAFSKLAKTGSRRERRKRSLIERLRSTAV